MAATKKMISHTRSQIQLFLEADNSKSGCRANMLIKAQGFRRSGDLFGLPPWLADVVCGDRQPNRDQPAPARGSPSWNFPLLRAIAVMRAMACGTVNYS